MTITSPNSDYHETPQSALIGAIERNRLAEAVTAISQGADVNYRDKAGETYSDTPLVRAITFARIEIVKLLIASGADVNRAGLMGRTPMHEAARRGNLEIATLLRDAGGRLDVQDDLHFTPHEFAAYCQNVELFQTLKVWKALLNTKTSRARDSHSR